MALSIEFDHRLGEVRRAEFSGVGGPDGRITLEIGQPNLAPEKLQPGFWTTDRTMIHSSDNDR
jgi:hypothetical protein